MNILLIVSGSIACYKSIELSRILIKSEHQVKVIMTQNAQLFIQPLSLETITGNSVYPNHSNQMEHINLGRWSDIIIIAPATANIISKIAHGIGDDLATSTILASTSTIIIAPAMNSEMLRNQIVSKNIKKLKECGYHILNTLYDTLACGETGYGKMLEPVDIYQEVLKISKHRSELNGQNVIITLGGTVEKIDNVRCITNFSSGIQGIELIKAFLSSGANVTAICGKINEQIVSHPNLEVIHIESATQMHLQIMKCLPSLAFISCAAVSDFKPKIQYNGKLSKENFSKTIELEENADILKDVKSSQLANIIIGFALEDGTDWLNHGHSKLLKKGCDISVVNNLNGGNIFGSTSSTCSIFESDVADHYESIKKSDIASIIVQKVVAIYNKKILS